MQKTREYATQQRIIVQILKEANGNPVSGMVFLRLDSPITQFHTRIFELQEQGYNIEPVSIEGQTYKAYKLLEERKQEALL